MTQEKNTLPVIKYGEVPNVLLLGNGINKAYDKCSWDELLQTITKASLSEEDSKLLQTMPYPLRPVVLTEDRVDISLEKIAVKMLECDMTQEQAKQIQDLVQLPFDAILTTNYTYEIEKAIDENFQCKMKSSSKYRKKTIKGTTSEEQFGLYRYMQVTGDAGERHIWHIHGETAKPSSMILGHYYYGKLLSKIQQYVGTVFSRYAGCNRYKKDFQPRSWIDYFLLGNVYIVGFGLDMSEMDLWWLINCKKRNAEKCGQTQCGKIYFYEPNMNQEKNFGKKMLLQAYNVEIETQDVKDEYKAYYKEVAESLQEQMKNDFERQKYNDKSRKGYRYEEHKNMD